ncbi:MAG TPA: tRNA pseudouridine(38-40) synthase TruA [Acidobacteriaceae bacterium]|jgi:tRNA pseudouridine38-40 synthase|nr:tRNA pseudouridine(38-40) synthase TruA [Acidobacteriaceae bacterium]
MAEENKPARASNWKLTLAYDGTDFYGWQVQPDRVTIQGTLANVVERVTGERVLPQSSGRTDAGVHARRQVASFRLEAPIPASNLLRALNRRLPESIRVLDAQPAAEEFHARHAARAKTYEYRIYRGEICPPWIARYAWALPSRPAHEQAGGPGRWPLDPAQMQSGAQRIIGTHDFTSFAASDPDRSARRTGDEDAEGLDPVRTIFASDWREEDGFLIYGVRGDGFLQHMVRNLVGTFVDVGRGHLQPKDVTRILEARSRSAAGATAPARGLFLDSVEY